MKSGLSARNFIKNNKKTVGALVLALAMVFTAIYVIAMLLNVSTESFRTVVFEMPKKVAFLDISTRGYGIRTEEFDSGEELYAVYEKKTQDLVERLKAVDGIEDAYYTQAIYSQYQSVFGMIGYEVPLLDAERIPDYLTHMEAQLTAGRMPEGEGEILVEEVLLKNADAQIGDAYMPFAYGDTFRIVGTLRSPYMTVVGTPAGFTNNGWFIVTEKDESIYDMTALLKDLGITISEADRVEDGVSMKSFYETEVKGMVERVIDTIHTIVTAFLAFTILIAYISYLRNRVNEYCLYMSIGYSRSAVYGMIMREMLMIFGAGAVLGMLAGLGGGWMIRRFMIEAKGLNCRVLMPEQIFRILATYVLIMGILQIPVLWSINAVKMIDAIEE